jgi:hypothetical protein
MMPKIFTSLFLLAMMISSQSRTQSHYTIRARLPWGSYSSYHWEPESVEELSYKEANKLLHKRMVIDSNYFILFTDTVLHPGYIMDTLTKTDFFNRYRLDEQKFNFLFDTITCVLVQKTPLFEETRLVLTGDHILANYGGYFFFFRKDK